MNKSINLYMNNNKNYLHVFIWIYLFYWQYNHEIKVYEYIKYGTLGLSQAGNATLSYYI